MPSAYHLDLELGFGEHETVDSVVDLATSAEDRGFATLSAGETTGWSVVPVLSAIATSTERITVADTVLSPYSRAPAAIGQTALAMHAVSGGRFRLGLGTSSPALAEQWHGESFDRPLRRLRETIDVVRAVYEGGAVDYHGDVFDVGGLRYERAPPRDPPPIDVAAIGPKSAELAGRFADGWVPQLFTRDGLQDRLADFERGVALSERSTDARRVSPIVRCCASEDAADARSIGRRMISFLVGAYGPFYGKSVASQGYADVVEEIRGAWEDGRDTDAMAAALPEELLDALAAVGTPDQVRETVASFGEIDGVDHVRVAFMSGMDATDRVATLDALEPLAGE